MQELRLRSEWYRKAYENAVRGFFQEYGGDVDIEDYRRKKVSDGLGWSWSVEHWLFLFNSASGVV